MGRQADRQRERGMVDRERERGMVDRERERGMVDREREGWWTEPSEGVLAPTHLRCVDVSCQLGQ